ncbi:fungal-specific transcription factor domain-containing protein [Aspergillus carlsbadensis]|nr:fungal-specific transcription factor domain-containing protein [Aspergillus carlsbadensis]
MASGNSPDEQTAAEQLLAFQTPPETDLVVPPADSWACPPSVPGERVSQVHGVDKMASQLSRAMPSGLFQRKDQGNSLFLGFTSTAAILALCIRDSSRETCNHLEDSESLSLITDSAPMCDEISCTTVNELPAQQVPSSTLAAQCANAFFEDYHAAYPIFDRTHVNLVLERYVHSGHRELAPLDRSVVYLVTALGACSRPGISGSKSIDSANLYALAWSLFSHAVAAPSVLSLQVLLLHVLYSIHWSKWSIAWVLCGIAVRVAQTLGLHLASPKDFGLDQIHTRLRARLWAVTLSLDAHLSMSQGRPPARQPLQYDSELVSDRGGLLQVPELQWPLSELLSWRVSLARIQQKVNKVFSSETTAELRLNCLEEVDRELIYWRDSLPLEFRPEQQTVLEGNGHIDIYMLHLDYFNLLQTVHWTLVNHRPGPGYSEYAAPRLRASESGCLGASMALVRTLNK